MPFQNIGGVEGLKGVSAVPGVLLSLKRVLFCCELLSEGRMMIGTKRGGCPLWREEPASYRCYSEHLPS